LFKLSFILCHTEVPYQPATSAEPDRRFSIVIRNRLGRLATILAATTMGLLLVGVGTTLAATPGWTRSNAVSVLESVGPGKDTAYTVTLFNDGPGNISTLFLKADKQASYVSDTTHCTLAPTLYCSFGAQNVDQTIVLTVAFTVPSSGSSFSANFSESANGFSTSDRGGHSRGDIFGFTGTTAITTGGGNFDAGYNVGNDTFLTSQAVGNRNIQATKLESGPALKPITIEDGIASLPCTGATECSRLIGEWSKLTVGDGTDGPFKVTLLVYGNAVSGSPSLSSLFLVHTDADGNATVIRDQCTFDGFGNLTSTNDCLAGLPAKVGKNYQFVAWLMHNGGLRGGY
jgi:hypothetical protein